MKLRTTVAILAFGLSAAGAFAQTATDTPPPKAPPEIVAPADKAPPPVPGHVLETDKPMAGKPDRLDRPPPRPRPGGAHYRVKVGQTMIDIKCAADEPTKDCGELLLHIIDRVSTPSEDHGLNDDDNDQDNGRAGHQQGNSRRGQQDDWPRG